MAETPSINIQIDQDALREQVEGVITQAMRDAAMRLRTAADGLDNGEWWQFHDENLKSEYERGFKAGQESKQQEGEAG